MTTRIAPPAGAFLTMAILCHAIPAVADLIPILSPDADSMLVRATVFDHQEFIILVPKSLGTADQTLMNFPATPMYWAEQTDPDVLEGSHTEEGVYDFQARLVAAPGRVTIHTKATNISDQPWSDAWLFTFLAPHGAPPFHDTAGESTFISVDGEVTPLADVDWPDSIQPTMAAFPFTGRADRLPRQVRDLDVQSATQPDQGWMIVTDVATDRYAAMVSPNPLFLFRNREISSLHVAPLLGDVAPGESASVEVTILFGAGDLTAATDETRSTFRDLQERYCPHLSAKSQE